jgi:hypothetical protein
MTADGIAESNQDGALFGWSVGTAGDVNGDGYSDMIVGAYQYDNDQIDEGRAFVYYGAPIYRTWMPALTRNYCTGPSVDGFGNPASGWPIAETAYWSYSYLSGEYRMYAKASAFGAASRGERPTGQFSVEVDTRIVSSVDGSSGILFGLTDDWSEFYTFEVYPNLQIGAIWHNQNGAWTLVTYAISGAIQTGHGSNHLKVETSTASGYQASFYINNTFISSLVLPYGATTLRRVGLTSSTDAAGFDARFDNYKLVYEGCPATVLFGAQQAGDAPNPTFETLRPVELEER